MQPAAAFCRRRVCYYGGSFDPPTYGHMIAAAAVAACGAADEVWISPCGGEAASTAATPADSPRPLSTAGCPTTADAAAAAAGAAPAAAAAALNGDVSTSCSTLADEGETHADALTNPLFRPDKKVKSSPQARLAMTQLAVSHFFGPADTRRVPIKVLGREATTRGYTPTLKLLQQLAAEEEEQQQRRQPHSQPDSQTEFLILVGEDVVPDLPHWHGGEKLMKNYSFLILPRSSPQHHLPQLLPHALSCNSRSNDSSQKPGDAASGPAPTASSSAAAAGAAPGSPPAAAIPTETAAAVLRASAAAGELKERVAAVLQRVRRYAYVEQLCLERGVPYFHWPCSSTFARRVLLHVRSDPVAAREAVSLVSPPVLAYIEEHGLYRE